MTYGKSNQGNYALALSNRVHGVWDAVEARGEFYSIIPADDIPEDDWDRLVDLEAEAERTRR